MSNDITFQMKAIQSLPVSPRLKSKFLSLATRSSVVWPCLARCLSSPPCLPTFSMLQSSFCSFNKVLCLSLCLSPSP